MAPTNCEQKKLQTLLKDAITLLCKSSLTYSRDVMVEGLLGITVDSEDVFLVNLNEIVCSNTTESSRSSQDSESGEKVLRGKTCVGCHSKQSSTGSESSRKRSLEVSENSSQCSEANKTDNGPPPLPARRRPKPIEPPNKRRLEVDDSTNSNTSVTTVIVKSQSFIEHDPTYQTLSPENTDPTNNQTVDIFDAPAASLLGTPLASSTVTWGNATTSTQISGSVPRFRPDLDLSNFSSPMFPPKNRADVSDSSPPGAIGTSSVHRKQAGRQAVHRKRKPVKGRKCLSMDGVLDTPKPSHVPKSFSMDTDDRMKNRYFKRSILLRRHSSRLNGSVSSKTSTLESTKSSSKSTTSDSDNHSCQYCGKTFASNAGLYYHLPIHTGRFKINCKTCGMGFMDTIKYRTHLQKECHQLIPDTPCEKNCENEKAI